MVFPPSFWRGKGALGIQGQGSRGANRVPRTTSAPPPTVRSSPLIPFLPSSRRTIFPSLSYAVELPADKRYGMQISFRHYDDTFYRYDSRARMWESHTDVWTIKKGMTIADDEGMKHTHPAGVRKGSYWNEHGVSFAHVRITNDPYNDKLWANPKERSWVSGCFLLRTFTNYIPVLHVVDHNGKEVATFEFEATKFIAVSHYLNPKLRVLKATQNPNAHSAKRHVVTVNTKGPARGMAKAKKPTPEKEDPPSSPSESDLESSSDDEPEAPEPGPQPRSRVLAQATVEPPPALKPAPPPPRAVPPNPSPPPPAPARQQPLRRPAKPPAKELRQRPKPAPAPVPPPPARIVAERKNADDGFFGVRWSAELLPFARGQGRPVRVEFGPYDRDGLRIKELLEAPGMSEDSEEETEDSEEESEDEFVPSRSAAAREQGKDEAEAPSPATPMDVTPNVPSSSPTDAGRQALASPDRMSTGLKRQAEPMMGEEKRMKGMVAVA
ncbi:hypothetical protein DFJ74DRAFT_475614 [Hyaloraphidium curvatum]|nr:hypothetical protein DFJ74DRAFT_475614 [Hyaloraphidium curvatum]